MCKNPIAIEIPLPMSIYMILIKNSTILAKIDKLG